MELYSFLIDNLFKYYLDIFKYDRNFVKILKNFRNWGMKILSYKIIGKEQFSNFYKFYLSYIFLYLPLYPFNKNISVLNFKVSIHKNNERWNQRYKLQETVSGIEKIDRFQGKEKESIRSYIPRT